MFLINHPITTFGIIVFAVTFCKIILRFSKKTTKSNYEKPVITIRCKILSAEDLQKGQEIILKASRGELTKEEYAEFINHIHHEESIPFEKTLTKLGCRRFQSPTGW
jgi:hypothetical protein